MCVIYIFTALKGTYFAYSQYTTWNTDQQMLGASFWQTPLLEALGLRIPGLPLLMQNFPINRWYMVIGGLILGFNIVQR